MDEKLDKDWTVFGVRKAVTILYSERSTLIDDLAKNLASYKSLYDLLHHTIFADNKRGYTRIKDDVYLAETYGYIKKVNGKVAISNRIFEILLTDYFIAIDAEAASIKPPASSGLYHELTVGGRFNMELCLRKFATCKIGFKQRPCLSIS